MIFAKTKDHMENVSKPCGRMQEKDVCCVVDFKQTINSGINCIIAIFGVCSKNI